MFVPMPPKTMRVLFITFVFLIAGTSIGALDTEGFTGLNVGMAIASHAAAAFTFHTIMKRSKEQRPLLGLSLGVWVPIMIIGYGLGLAMLYMV